MGFRKVISSPESRLGEMHKSPEKCGHFSELQLLYTNCESDELN